MKTEHRLADALKSLMAEVPLDSISVTTLTKKCRIKRQTFYYHFHDIYDLLTLVFLNEKLGRNDDIKNINDLINVIFNYYSTNRSFIEATMNSAGKELFQEFIYNNCYRHLLHFVEHIDQDKILKPNDRKIISRFYAFAYSNSIVYYLSTYKTKTIEGLRHCFLFLDNDELDKAVQKMIERRNKTHE